MSKNKNMILLFVILNVVSIILGCFLTNDYSKQEVYYPDNHFYIYFSQNIRYSLLLSVAGFFSFGIISILLIGFNGFNLGASIKLAYIRGESILDIIFKIVPHGVFELFGIYCFFVIGCYGIYLLFKIFNNTQFRPIIESSFKEIVLLVFLGILAIVIAAVIETII